ncbi:AI-2E family transporter [Petrocella sp. FN5]|uniref:AI-2E family transporter n=1 Tax=Petrocella sp. FN5 TaxID=3032002 RepID=UPI0023DA18B9|nr:AI-2E family transporter [Petrocella sp. FN5]MDF1618050.1 AI-2E family transporter [Petrocella sp. FN5]
MGENGSSQVIESTLNRGVLEQMILSVLFILLCLLVYFTYHIGNKHVNENNKLSLNFSHLKLLFFMLLGSVFFWWIWRHLATLTSILTPFIFAGVFAYAFNPLVKHLMSFKLSRFISVLIIFIGLILMIVGFSYTFFPMMVTELNSLLETLPNIGKDGYDRFSDWYQRIFDEQYIVPNTIEDLFESLNIGFQSITDWFSSSTGKIVSRVGSFASSLVHIVTVPVLTFYFMKDADKFSAVAKKLVLPGSRKWVFPLMKKIDGVLGGFIRGQILVAMIIGMMSSLVLLLLGVEYWIVLGLLAGLGDLIPYIGPFLGAIPAVFITLSSDPWKTLWVIVAFIVIQQIESNLISPKIVGHSVGLHPVAIIFVLLLGGSLWGLIGLLVSVPLAGVFKVIVESIYDWFKARYPRVFDE